MSSLLKVDPKDKGYKHIGALLPADIHAYLTFYGLAHGVTKSDVLKSIIEGWINRQKVLENDSKLLYKIIAKLNLQWRTQKTRNISLSFSTYKEIVTYELRKKGLSDNLIETITNAIKREWRDRTD